MVQCQDFGKGAKTPLLTAFRAQNIYLCYNYHHINKCSLADILKTKLEVSNNFLFTFAFGMDLFKRTLWRKWKKALGLLVSNQYPHDIELFN